MPLPQRQQHIIIMPALWFITMAVEMRWPVSVIITIIIIMRRRLHIIMRPLPIMHMRINIVCLSIRRQRIICSCSWPSRTAVWRWRLAAAVVVEAEM